MCNLLTRRSLALWYRWLSFIAQLKIEADISKLIRERFLELRCSLLPWKRVFSLIIISTVGQSCHDRATICKKALELLTCFGDHVGGSESSNMPMSVIRAVGYSDRSTKWGENRHCSLNIGGCLSMNRIREESSSCSGWTQEGLNMN